MRFVLALLLALLFAAPARAYFPDQLVNVPLACFTTGDRGFALAGYVEIFAEPGGPAGYAFDESFFSKKVVGAWDGDGTGAVVFRDGPITAGVTLDAAPPGTTMPGDDVEGRTWPLIMRGPATWYCQSNRINPRRTLAEDARLVSKRSGIPVRLPARLEQEGIQWGGDHVFSLVEPHVRVARRGLWRLDVMAGPCGPGSCVPMATFSAKRAPARDLLGLRPVRLAEGVRGRVGGVGCGPHPGPANWGPVSCGVSVVLWHQGAINHAIEAGGVGEAGLIDLANQTIRAR